MLGRLWRFLVGGPSKEIPAAQRARNVFLISRPLFTPSFELLDAVRAARRTHPPDDVEREHDAFLLDPGLGPATYLSRDGRILWDDDGWGVRGTRNDAYAAILAGIHKTKVEALRQLLPSRLPDALDCEQCGATGNFTPSPAFVDTKGNIRSFICTQCAGLGWRSPTLDLDESVIESVTESGLTSACS